MARLPVGDARQEGEKHDAGRPEKTAPRVGRGRGGDGHAGRVGEEVRVGALVIVLVVAVLPTIGSGGMSLMQAEAPGPTGERLTPRVRETARRLWAVYIGFTIALAVAYFSAGMSPTAFNTLAG